MRVQLTLGMGGQSPPPTLQPPLSQVWAALQSPFLQTIPAPPSPPGPRLLQPFTRCPTGQHLGRLSSRDSLPGPSVVAPCPALLPDPSMAAPPAATPLALPRWKSGSGRDPGAAEGKGRASAQRRARLGASATTPARQGAPKSLLPALTLRGVANKQANKQTGVGRAEEYTEPVCGCAQSPTVGSRDPHNHCHSQPCAAGWGFGRPHQGTWRGDLEVSGRVRGTVQVLLCPLSPWLQPTPAPGRNTHKNGACAAWCWTWPREERGPSHSSVVPGGAEAKAAAVAGRLRGRAAPRRRRTAALRQGCSGTGHSAERHGLHRTGPARLGTTGLTLAQLGSLPLGRARPRDERPLWPRSRARAATSAPRTAAEAPGVGGRGGQGVGGGSEEGSGGRLPGIGRRLPEMGGGRGEEWGGGQRG